MAIRFIPENISNYYGNLPLFQKGINKGRIDRNELSQIYNLNKKQVQKAYVNWIEIFRYKDSSLKFSEYLDKLTEANILPEDVGIKNFQYNLSRYQDLGSYSKENCRFILKSENLEEQHHPMATEETRKKMSIAFKGRIFSEDHKKNLSIAAIKRHKGE